MEGSRRLIEVFGDGRLPLQPRLTERAGLVYRALASAPATAWELTEPLRVRLRAPLIAPPQFRTMKEYRIWKSRRSARPRAWDALQWPLRTWLLIGAGLLLWAKSLLS